jgi:hypothetical protein
MDPDDILKFIALLEEQTAAETVFVARDLRRIPQIDPSSVDLCFLLETVSDLRQKVDSLMDVKKQIDSLQGSVNGLIASTKMMTQHSIQPRNAGFVRQSASEVKASAPGAGSSEMANDVSLRVNIPQQPTIGSSTLLSAAPTAPLNGAGNRMSYAQMTRKPPVVGSKTLENSTIKASSKPRELHVYVGNLDLGTTSDNIKD